MPTHQKPLGVTSHSEARLHRDIDFKVPPPPVDPVAGAYHHREVKDTKHGRTIIERQRDGNTMVITITKNVTFEGRLGEEHHESTKTIRMPALIDFQMLLNAVEVEDDDHTEMPWESGDGWEHAIEELESDSFGGSSDDFKKTRGYLPHRGRYKYERVVVTDESYCGDSRKARFEYFHRRGASKQVAREMVAKQDRAYIDQLVEWYDHYQEVYVKLEIEIGGKTYEDSCGGFDEEYGRNEARREIASNVIYALEKDGYTVVGYDRHAEYNKNRTWHKKEQLRRNLHLFDWTD